VCHYKLSKTEGRSCVFNRLQAERLKKAQTWASRSYRLTAVFRLNHLPGLLPSPAAPIFAAIDDTILKKTGRRIPGVKILRDPMSPAFHVNFCYGLRFVQVSVLVSPQDAAGPARALPVRFDFAPPANKPKKNAPQEDRDNYKEEQKKRTLSRLGVEAIVSLRASLDQRPETRQRQLIVSGDGSYTNHSVLPRLPERTTGLRKAQGAEASLLQHPIADVHLYIVD
jgi:hypothetical protein